MCPQALKSARVVVGVKIVTVSLIRSLITLIWGSCWFIVAFKSNEVPTGTCQLHPHVDVALRENCFGGFSKVPFQSWLIFGLYVAILSSSILSEFDLDEESQNLQHFHSDYFGTYNDNKLDWSLGHAEIMIPIIAVVQMTQKIEHGQKLPIAGSKDIWAPFKSDIDYEVAKWAKLQGAGSTAFSDLLSIPGVSERLGLFFKNS
ncbi:hypothetical protein SERLADRAFT_404762 [Serpula lacrymans var. lacrymans S7.9]|uniref:Uncharacterized protein n=1 Tax=Serpula lacrymans var. lacrymans (strain S7.9) TaxID=578457 RepID=F8NCW1_SERL9|nr:uncharacterized protein SERLADRAFT_404762 [Serpula lacrymans var. lacrymans S7.9]EGO30705.1 hypothetical protein SERLADRAFT_404762 [Serpula lacrymans var. lacrymans S7.9]